MLKSSIYLSGSVSCYQFASVLTLKIVYRRISLLNRLEFLSTSLINLIPSFFLKKRSNPEVNSGQG